jgi:hypothetical protein
MVVENRKKSQSLDSNFATNLLLISVYWGHLEAARRFAIGANRKRMLKTRDIPTLTNRHLRLNIKGYNPPLSAISTKISQRYWKIVNHQGLSCFRFFR